MAKRKLPKLTAEELAQRAETQRMVAERIAYHEAKAVEREEVAADVVERINALRAVAAAATKQSGRLTAEELAVRAETQRMVEERIADHTAKAREEEGRGGEAAEG